MDYSEDMKLNYYDSGEIEIVNNDKETTGITFLFYFKTVDELMKLLHLEMILNGKMWELILKSNEKLYKEIQKRIKPNTLG